MPKYAHATLGNDSNDGSLLNPYQTIRKLADNVPANDVGYCRGGDFTNIRADDSSSNDTFYNMPNGTGGNYTTIKAYENEPVRFLSNSATAAMIGLRNGWTYKSFEDIEWVGNGQAGSTYQVFMKRLSSSYSGSFIRVQNSHIHDFRAHAILLAGYTDSQFLDLRIHHCGFSGQEHGLYLAGLSHRTEVGRCTIHTVSGWGIHHNSSSGDADDGRYHDNDIYNYGTSGVGGAGEGIIVNNGIGTWVWNNIIHHGALGTSGAGMSTNWASGSTNTRFINNLVYKARLEGIHAGDGSGHLLQNNIFIECGLANVYGSSTLVTNLTTGTGTAIWVDPETLFDFHLLEGASGARGTGTRHADFLTDKNGVSRPSPCDIGPYEYAAAFPPSIGLSSPRITQINVPFSFSSFDVSHNGDLDRVVVYAERGVLA